MQDEQERINFAYDIVKQKLLESADRNVRNKDKKAKESHIDVDDRVMVKYVKNKPGDNKLSPRFSGPFRVTARKSPTVFKIKNLITGKITEAHIENCKIVKEKLADLSEFPNARLPLQEPAHDQNSHSPQENNTKTNTQHSDQVTAKTKQAEIPDLTQNRRVTRAMIHADNS